MSFATTMVFLQTPAIGITQAGLIRRKNSLSMLMQTMTGLVIGSILWYDALMNTTRISGSLLRFFFGFSLAFGPSVAGVIGNLDHALFLDIPSDTCMSAAPRIPGKPHFYFRQFNVRIIIYFQIYLFCCFLLYLMFS
jgi:Amt family ammonium transporter